MSQNMKCPGCFQETLNSKEVYWSSGRSLVTCTSCKKKFYIKRGYSSTYWSIQLGGLTVFLFMFLGWAWAGIWGIIFSIFAVVGVGALIHFAEYKYSGLKSFTGKVYRRKQIIERVAIVFITLFVLGIWLTLILGHV